MNNIHSDKYNLAVNASESSSMTYTYLRKINKKNLGKYFQIHSNNVLRPVFIIGFFKMLTLKTLAFSCFVNQLISHI